MRRFLPFLLALGCASSPDVEEKKVSEKISDEDRDAILDAPVKIERSKVAAANLARLELPDTPNTPAREIDGELDDWDRKLFRIFDKKTSIESGERFWRGPRDLAMRIAADSDQGYLYLAVDVKDDEVIAGDNETVVDAIVVTIRDPSLDRFVRAVPQSAKIQDMVKAETKLIFFPDGRYGRYDSSDPLPDNMGVISIQENDEGWRLELALQIEAFEQVSSIPLETVAFRVDLLDGDEADRPGTQTVFSMLPDRGNDEPRMALFNTAGLLPHFEVNEAPPRKNAIGTWVAEEQTWNFTAFERVPEIWVTIDDRKAFEEAVRASESVNDLCQVARKDVQLVETYASRGGGFRAGLLVCGDREVRGSCPKNSKTDVFWLMLNQNGGSWLVEKAIKVFPESLNQCATKAVEDEEFYFGFSMFPLDMIDHYTWAVGWEKTQKASQYDYAAEGLTIIQTELSNPVIGSVLSDEKRSERNERVKTVSKVYLSYVDDDGHWDICSVEDALEQSCAGVDQGCKTYEHGKQILTTTQLYNPKTRRFERYELSKHPGCNADFDFSEREGFLLMQSPGRIGFLPSPSMEEGENLQLF